MGDYSRPTPCSAADNLVEGSHGGLNHLHPVPFTPSS